MLTLKCQECNNEFEAQRTSAKFCSAKCRVKFNSYEHPIKDLNDYTKIDTEEAKKGNSIPTFVDQTFFTLKEPIQCPEPVTVPITKTFESLLKEFNDLVEKAPSVSEIKGKLENIKLSAVNSSLTPRQVGALCDRVDNYIKGQYDTQKHNLKLA
jgi:hypothetical protein